MNDKDYKTTCTVPEPVEGTTVGASTSSATEGKTTRLLTFVFSLLSLAFFISSCSTEKHLGKSNLKPLSANHLIREIEDNKFDFDNLETKFDVKFKDKYDGSVVRLKGQLRMQSDSAIWVSISLNLGVELARVMITDDSVKFINRTDKIYHTIGTKAFDSILLNQNPPIDNPLRWVQDILTGNINLVKDDKYQVLIENDKYKMATKNKRQKDMMSNDRNIFVTPKTFKVSRYEIIKNLPTGRPDKEEWYRHLELGLDYDNFKNINGKLIPSKITFESSSFTGRIEIDYTEIKIGEKVEFPFNVSKKYDRVIL